MENYAGNIIDLPIILLEGGVPPQYETVGAAGMDIRAAESADIPAGVCTLVRTGFAVEVPEGYELQIRARSGLAYKQGIMLVNGVGTIDSDYRGEVGVLLTKLGGMGEKNTPYHITKGDRIAQMLLVPLVNVRLQQTTELSESNRGAEGFGSSGNK